MEIVFLNWKFSHEINSLLEKQNNVVIELKTVYEQHESQNKDVEFQIRVFFFFVLIMFLSIIYVNIFLFT
jgi:hypothetical protein